MGQGDKGTRRQGEWENFQFLISNQPAGIPATGKQADYQFPKPFSNRLIGIIPSFHYSIIPFSGVAAHNDFQNPQVQHKEAEGLPGHEAPPE